MSKCMSKYMSKKSDDYSTEHTKQHRLLVYGVVGFLSEPQYKELYDTREALNYACCCTLTLGSSYMAAHLECFGRMIA